MLEIFVLVVIIIEEEDRGEDINGNFYQNMSRKIKNSKIRIFEDPRPFILWARVSTEKQGESGLGLAAQETIAKVFMGKDPIAVYTDVYTGTKLRQCKNLWAAIERCKNENLLLVVAKSDRMRSVQEALDVLDAVGDGRLIFCDLPSSDRFVLTVMFAMHERTALIGRINTRVAMQELKKKIKEDGGFVSKAGNFCDHLGRKKGDKNPNAVMAMADKKTEIADDWRKRSPLYLMVSNMLLRGEPRSKILQMANELYEDDPKAYGTRTGKPLGKGVLSGWATEILLHN